MKITADTQVMVQRTVSVSTETTIGELVHDTDTDEAGAVWAFMNGPKWANLWIETNHVAELVPSVSGDDLDSDVWTVTVQR